MQTRGSGLLAALTLSSLSSLSGCVNDENFFGLLDPPPPDAGPGEGPPPVFPLKEGDELRYPGIGGRVEPCSGAEGSCERDMRMTYTVEGVKLDEDTNTWEIEAYFLYELVVGVIEEAAMGQLFISHVAPFADVDVGGSDDGTAKFSARSAPTDGIRANGFPFFHFDEQYANRDDSAYKQASTDFSERIRELDPAADVENQAAEGKIEAYFKDELAGGAAAKLHKVRVDYHPMGFVCDWDERLIPWDDDMQRQESDFAGSIIPLAAVFADPIRLIRDDVQYRCSCAAPRVCSQLDDASLCLDPKDPESAPVACSDLAE